MQAEATDTKQLLRDYFQALSSAPKTDALIDRYVSDPSLKGHILQTDAEFPGYSIEVHEFIGEGDLVAVRGTVHGAHKESMRMWRRRASRSLLGHDVLSGSGRSHFKVLDAG